MVQNLVKLVGQIKEIGELQVFSEKFSKRSLVLDITDNPKYANYLSIDFSNDKAELLNNLKQGDEVRVTIALRGRDWVDKKTGVVKYFNSIDAIGIEYAPVNDVTPKLSSASINERVESNLQTKQIDNQGSTIPLDLGGDDLPF